MQYRTMPRSSEKLSVLGFGCMRLPTKVGGISSKAIDKDKALEQIRRAIDNGVNYLDTAYFYHLGASEKFLGEYVLKDGYREKVKIATKLPCMLIKKKKSIKEIFNKQLKRLQTDYIDYYLLHALDGKSWQEMKALGIIEFMDEMKLSKQVIHMGFSFHGKKEDFKVICDEYNFDFAQVQYNILDEHFQAGIEGIDYAHSLGMGIIVMEPLRGGALVGKLPKEIKKIYDEASVKRPPVDWALRWILNNPKVTLLLSGMNNLEHIDQNIEIASTSFADSMTKDELNVMEDVKNTYHNLLKVGCTGCSYCLPCPALINIPQAFKNLNNYHMFSKFNARVLHAIYLGVQTTDFKPHFTSDCIDCGKCEEKCPQDIEIRKVFKQVKKDLEGPLTKIIALLARTFSKKKKKRNN